MVSLKVQLLLATTTSSLIDKANGLAFLSDTVLDFSLGAVSGAVGAAVAYPADFLTCQMQTEGAKERYANGVDCLFQTVRDEGPLQLFRGFPVQVAGVAPEKAIKLSVNDMAKSMLAGCLGGKLNLWGEVLAGSVAGICQVVATCPLEVLKVGLQTSNTTVSELMVEIGGIPGLFRGAEACILRDVLISATMFPIYSHAHEVMPALLAGSLAGVAVGIVGAPPDFIKTRIMARNGASMTTPNYVQRPKLVPAMANPFMVEYRQDGDMLLATKQMINTYYEVDSTTNPFVVGSNIIKKEGWPVMFTGVAERIFASIPRFGVTLSMYDCLKDLTMGHGLVGGVDMPIDIPVDVPIDIPV